MSARNIYSMRHLQRVYEHQMELDYEKVNEAELIDMIEAVMDECLEIQDISLEEGIRTISGRDVAAQKIVEMMIREKVIR